MRIVIDKIFAPEGHHIADICVHTDGLSIYANPDGTDSRVTFQVLMDMYNADPSLREKAGWHEVSQLEGEDQPMTRWQRLVAHTNSPEGCPTLKILNLGEYHGH